MIHYILYRIVLKISKNAKYNSKELARVCPGGNGIAGAILVFENALKWRKG